MVNVKVTALSDEELSDLLTRAEEETKRREAQSVAGGELLAAISTINPTLQKFKWANGYTSNDEMINDLLSAMDKVSKIGDYPFPGEDGVNE